MTRSPWVWVLLGVLIGAMLMAGAHVLCPTCQSRAAGLRRWLGLRILE